MHVHNTSPWWYTNHVFRGRWPWCHSRHGNDSDFPRYLLRQRSSPIVPPMVTVLCHDVRAPYRGRVLNHGDRSVLEDCEIP